MHLITEGFDCEVCTLYLPSKEVLESHKRFFSILRNGKQATTFRDTLRKQKYVLRWQLSATIMSRATSVLRENTILRDTLCRITV